MPRSLPELFIPAVPFTIETFMIIAPYALAMALVGLLESLRTAKFVDDITDSHSNKTRESLGAVMVMVCVATFDRHSIRWSTFKRMPLSETLVMAITVAVVVVSHNLAIGVIVGVVVPMIAFSRRVAHVVNVERRLPADENVPTAHYRVTGELFFASSNDLTTRFEYADDPDRVVIDMAGSHIWDASVSRPLTSSPRNASVTASAS